MGELQHEVHAGCLDEHHGVRVEEVLCGIAVDLQDVVVEPQPPSSRLASGGDLIRDNYRGIILRRPPPV